MVAGIIVSDGLGVRVGTGVAVMVGDGTRVVVGEAVSDGEGLASLGAMVGAGTGSDWCEPIVEP